VIKSIGGFGYDKMAFLAGQVLPRFRIKVGSRSYRNEREGTATVYRCHKECFSTAEDAIRYAVNQAKLVDRRAELAVAKAEGLVRK
jgi:hypothetical protein